MIYTNEHFTLEDFKEHCEVSIKICEEKILVDGPNGSDNWIRLKELWEQQLQECEEELKTNKYERK